MVKNQSVGTAHVVVGAHGTLLVICVCNAQCRVGFAL